MIRHGNQTTNDGCMCIEQWWLVRKHNQSPPYYYIIILFFNRRNYGIFIFYLFLIIFSIFIYYLHYIFIEMIYYLRLNDECGNCESLSQELILCGEILDDVDIIEDDLLSELIIS